MANIMLKQKQKNGYGDPKKTNASFSIYKHESSLEVNTNIGDRVRNGRCTWYFSLLHSNLGQNKYSMTEEIGVTIANI